MVFPSDVGLVENNTVLDELHEPVVMEIRTKVLSHFMLVLGRTLG